MSSMRPRLVLWPIMVVSALAIGMVLGALFPWTKLGSPAGQEVSGSAKQVRPEESDGSAGRGGAETGKNLDGESEGETTLYLKFDDGAIVPVRLKSGRPLTPEEEEALGKWFIQDLNERYAEELRKAEERREILPKRLEELRREIEQKRKADASQSTSDEKGTIDETDSK